MTAHDDRARDEQDQALQDLVDQAQELGLYEQTCAPTARETAARNLTPHLDPRDPRAHTTELPTEREIPADELQSEERACAISPVFRETALRLAPLVGKSYPEVPMQLLDEVFGELIEKGVIR